MRMDCTALQTWTVLENMPTPDLTIVIPTRDRVDDLQRLLKSLANQSDKNLRILIINNDGPEVAKAVECVSQGLSIQVATDPTPNLAHLFNHGLTSVDSEIVGYLNDDTEVGPSWVQEARQT